MFSNSSVSSEENSDNDDIPPCKFTKHTYDISQINDSSSSSKSFGEEDDEDVSNGRALEENLNESATLKRYLPDDFEHYERPTKKAFSDRYDRKEKHKKKYVFNEDIANSVSSTNVPIQAGNIGRSMLEKMGYQSGKGLGKHAQGIVEPVALSKQRGRRGLGVSLPDLDPASLIWDSSYEVINLKEEVQWVIGDSLESLDLDTLRSWKMEGPKNKDIKEMTDFCDEKLLLSVLKHKEVFDHLTPEEVTKARSRSNPFEKLGSGIFLNRAALKMANMDARFDFMFTDPKYETGDPMVQKNELLYFADVCAGPGGFSEYVLWKKKWYAKGYGFTLKGDCDFKLCDFSAGSPETFEPYYGEKDDGNVFDPDNIRSLTEYVLKGTKEGVHFMMADGGFSVKGQENYQEILSKQLYLCQCLVALSIVRNEGHFVCKLFDLFSPFSAGIIYLMYRSFKKISIFKPNTSRPANSERYIICKHKRSDCAPIKDYMFELNKRLWEFGSVSSDDIIHCVPLPILESDDVFFNYLVDSNNRLGERQVVNLLKVAAFFRDKNLIEERQDELKKESLKMWEVPDKPRLIDKTTAEDAAKKTGFSVEGSEALKTKTLELELLSKTFNSLYDWHCIPLGSKTVNLYLGLGRNKIFRWVPSSCNWTKETNCNAELNPGTLVYGEIVPELIGEQKQQKKIKALHVVDAFALGYENIYKLHYRDRLEMMNLYASALKKQVYKDKFPVRIKQPIPMEQMTDIFNRLSIRYLKMNSSQLILENEEYWLEPKGILFVNTTKEPWSRFISRKTNFHYYFNSKTGDSKYDKDRPADANASTLECIEKDIIWIWEEGVGLKEEGPIKGVVHKDELIKFILHKNHTS